MSLLELGEIVETVFYSSGDREVDYEILLQDEHDMCDFCIDPQGRVRKSLGIVNTVKGEDDNLDYVPSVRYGINPNPWNSHSAYVEMELPNPVNEVELYHLIRTAMIKEFTRRLKRQIRNAKARLKRRGD